MLCRFISKIKIETEFGTGFGVTEPLSTFHQFIKRCALNETHCFHTLHSFECVGAVMRKTIFMIILRFVFSYKLYRAAKKMVVDVV